jgi:hypothetical protein
MFRKNLTLLIAICLLIGSAGFATAQAPRFQEGQDTSALQAEGPITSTASWKDTFEDDFGLASALNSTTTGGDLLLSQVVPVGFTTSKSDILAMTEIADGRVYLGTSGASLDVYNPATRKFTYLGYPVPSECYH